VIVFLDFDGVLNHAEWFRRRGPKPETSGEWTEERARWCFDPATAPRLNRLAEAGARFVISSTWRMGGLEEMRTILSLLGVRGEVIGCTPDLSTREPGRILWRSVERGTEIQAWLDANGNPGPIVILDDDTDMGPLYDRLVQTDDRTGLLDEHVTRALELLGVPLSKAEHQSLVRTVRL
jgi:hypothetical protein